MHVAFQFTNSEILTGVGTIADWVKAWALPLAAIGTVSMALLQTAKNVFPMRRRFQKSLLQDWLIKSAAGATFSTRKKVCADSASKDLIRLSTSGDEDAFFDLPIEDLCARIRSTTTVILDYPTLHEHIFLCLANGSLVQDIDKLLHPPKPEIFLKRADEHTQEDKLKIREYAAAKTRLTAQVRCSVDAIQTLVAYRWKYRLQVASLALSAFIGVIALNLGAGVKGVYPTIGGTVLIAVMSGFLAPVARDLVAGIEKWRN